MTPPTLHRGRSGTGGETSNTTLAVWRHDVFGPRRTIQSIILKLLNPYFRPNVGLGTRRTRGRDTSDSPSNLRSDLYEFEKIGIDQVCVRGRHPVRQLRLFLQTEMTNWHVIPFSPMPISTQGIAVLLQELRRKATSISLFYKGINHEPLSKEKDWPRDAEIDLIEALVLKKTQEVTGQSEISEALWQRCHPFARRIAAPWLENDKQRSEITADAQTNYELGEAKYHEGVALWVDHTTDYLNYLQASGTNDSLSVDRATILFLAASPWDKARLRLDEEVREIREELERARLRDRFVPEARGAVRPKDFVRSILDLSPEFVHFAGHGTKDGAICGEDDFGGTKEMSPDAVASIFEAAGNHVKCVVMNSCFSEAQARAISVHVPFVVGTLGEIDDDAAIAFSRGFYRAIGAGRTVKEAFQFALVEIKIYSLPGPLIPVLLERP
jgi:hypothetical protein